MNSLVQFHIFLLMKIKEFLIQFHISLLMKIKEFIIPPSQMKP